MSLSISFEGTPVDKLTMDIARLTEIQEADTLLILNQQKTRILERTARGQDINGGQFAGYSTKGPYYYYPYGRGNRQGLLGLTLTAFGRPMTMGRYESGRRSAALTRFAKKTGGVRVGNGIKYASYAAFKAALGRSNVDLLGPRAPHMLQAFVVSTRGPNEGVIGIYGSEADRATGHNRGVPARRLPKREFFGWGDKDKAAVIDSMQALLGKRIKEL